MTQNRKGKELREKEREGKQRRRGNLKKEEEDGRRNARRR